MRELFTDLFLDDLEINFPNHQLYRLKDVVKGQSPGAYPIDFEKAEGYNNDKQQFSIFFTPNGDFHKHEGERKKTNAGMIYAFVIDRDDTVDNKVKFWEDFEMQPSIVVETYRGYHAYWLLETPVSYSEKGKQWEKIQNYLVEQMGGDKQAKDISRILRLPGYRYWKYEAPDGKFIPQVVLYDPDLKYDFDEVVDAYKSEEELVESFVKEQKTFEKRYPGDNVYQQINNNVDVTVVLNELSKGKWEVRGTRMYENGNLTGGFRYKKAGNFVHSFSGHDRPSGQPFAVAKWFLKEDREVFAYFAERWGIGEIFKENLVIKQTSPDEVQPEDKWLRYEGKNAIINVGENEMVISYDDYKIYKRTSEKKTTEIMDGVIYPIGYYNDADDKKMYIVKYARKTNKGGIDQGYIYMHTLGRKDELLKRLSTKGLTFFGKSPYDKWLVAFVHSSSEQYEFINKAGVYGSDLIINKPGTYIAQAGDGKKIFCVIEDLKPSNRESNQIFELSKPISRADVGAACGALEGCYEKRIAHTLFITYALSLFTFYIRNHFSSLPIVIMTGLTQSGKTYLRHVMMKLFGMDKCVETQAAATEFAIMNMSKHYLPINIGEYQNDLLRFDWDTMMKNNYDNTQNTRGTSDQKIKTYELNCMLVVDGETRSMTNSVYSRSISLQMNPKYRKGLMHDPKNINRYFIDNYDKIKNIKNYLAKRREYLVKRFEKEDKAEKERILDNYSFLLAFAETFDLLEFVQESLIEQCSDQIAMMGEDNLDKIIKEIFTIAIINRMLVKVHQGNIMVDFLADTLRIDKKKFEDIRSNIVNLNIHFHGDKEIHSDKVIIPLSHLYRNKALHFSLNRILGYSFRAFGGPDTTDDLTTYKSLRTYAESEGYTKQDFYDIITVSEHGKYLGTGQGAKQDQPDLPF